MLANKYACPCGDADADTDTNTHTHTLGCIPIAAFFIALGAFYVFIGQPQLRPA